MIRLHKSNLNEYSIRRLQENETIKSFDCGDDDLNDFIMNRADDYHKAMLSVTYVFEHKASGKSHKLTINNWQLTVYNWRRDVTHYTCKNEHGVIGASLPIKIAQ